MCGGAFAGRAALFVVVLKGDEDALIAVLDCNGRVLCVAVLVCDGRVFVPMFGGDAGELGDIPALMSSRFAIL